MRGNGSSGQRFNTFQGASNLLGQIARSESGATVIEYGIIACIIALGVIAGAEVAGKGLDHMFQIIGISLNTATNAAVSSTGN